MSARHTPGPWVNEGPYLRSEKGARIAHINATGTGEGRANARLIAAAPELLEQLTLALPYVECALDDKGYKPGAIAARTKAIRDAISKATGES